MAQIPELVRGAWLDERLIEDDDARREAEALCDVLATAVMDAALNLILFDESLAMLPPRPTRERWERERDAEMERVAELEATDPYDSGKERRSDWMDRIRERARRDVVHARWAKEGLPEDYRYRRPYLHAQSFVLSAALVLRTLDALCELELGEAKQAVEEARDELKDAVPGVRSVRNSLSHPEDRMRFLGMGGTPVIPAPVNDAGVVALEGGVLMGDVLDGRNYGWTGADGDYATVEVSETTVRRAWSAVQRAFNALPWRDNRVWRYEPNR